MRCEPCKGTGKIGACPIPCDDCGGTGFAHCCEGVDCWCNPVVEEIPDADALLVIHNDVSP
jgi:hypothetical protein